MSMQLTLKKGKKTHLEKSKCLPFARCPNKKDSRIALFLEAWGLAFVHRHPRGLGNLLIDDPQARNLAESNWKGRVVGRLVDPGMNVCGTHSQPTLPRNC